MEERGPAAWGLREGPWELALESVRNPAPPSSHPPTPTGAPVGITQVKPPTPGLSMEPSPSGHSSKEIQDGEEGNTMPEPPEKNSRAWEWIPNTSSFILTKPSWKAWRMLWSDGLLPPAPKWDQPHTASQCSSCGRTDQNVPELELSRLGPPELSS